MRLNDKNPLDLKTLVIRFEGVDCSGDKTLRDDTAQWGLISMASDDRQTGGCVGDSGAPLIVWVKGAPRVAGIANGSLRGRSCDHDFVFTNLDFYGPWIEQAKSLW